MSVNTWVMSSSIIEGRVNELLEKASQLLDTLLKHQLGLALRGSFVDRSTNKIIRDATTQTNWNWPSSEYLWIAVDGIKGGIDVEVEIVDNETRQFFLSDIPSRRTDWNVITLDYIAKHSCMRYNFRLGAQQSRLLYLAVFCVAAVLADQSEGFVYTVDDNWISAKVPLVSHELRSLLSDPTGVGTTDLAFDISAAIQETLQLRHS